MNKILLFLSLLSISINIYLLVLVNHKSESNENPSGTQQLKNGASLRELAEKKNFWIGTALQYEFLIRDRKYRQILKEQFNMVSIENSMKFSNIHPVRDRYNFSETDLLVEFAAQNHMKVRGHLLISDEMIPSWVTESKLSKDEAKQILKKHIQTIVSRYKGKVVAWDVVSGAFHDDGTFQDNFWLRSLGPEYIELAFRWAHEADPNALLFYNDYDNEELNTKSETIYQMILDFKKRGVPIDGVGMQMHTSTDIKLDQESIAKNMKRLADKNIQVQITDVEVRINGNNLSANDNLNKQAKIYGNTLKTCLSAYNCTAFVMSGFTDRSSWQKEYFPFILDVNYRLKPAYHTITKILSEYEPG